MVDALFPSAERAAILAMALHKMLKANGLAPSGTFPPFSQRELDAVAVAIWRDAGMA